MDDYSKEMKRIQRMLHKCESPSDTEDDSESESDFVEDDGHIPDSDCFESELDKPPKQSLQKRSRCDGWLGKGSKTRW